MHNLGVKTILLVIGFSVHALEKKIMVKVKIIKKIEKARNPLIYNANGNGVPYSLKQQRVADRD